jgi:hypothetical protein
MPFNAPIVHVDEKTCSMFGVGESIEKSSCTLIII